jgi:hypothetical protein
MELQPAATGLKSLGDALPHPLSLLQALAPGVRAEVENVFFSTREPDAAPLTIRFVYRSDTAVQVQVQVTLSQAPRQPRRAAYAVDGRRAERLVSPRDYRLSFADSNRTVPMADPLTELVADFVGALRGRPGSATRGPEIAQRGELLAALVAAYRHGDTP